MSHDEAITRLDRSPASKILPVLTIVVFVLAALTVWTLLRVGGIETGNRDIICQSRDLRERYAPETALERAMLDNARRNATDCRR